MSSSRWKKVIHAIDCKKCELCGEPICPQCKQHYSVCQCPGPSMEDTHEYRTNEAGELEARWLPEYRN